MNPPPADVLLHVRVRGRVQGVGYRAFVERLALQSGLEGWVRNRHDGSVEAVLSGPAEAVSAMVERCRRGPASAHVDGFEAAPGAPDLLSARRPGERFSLLPTA